MGCIFFTNKSISISCREIGDIQRWNACYKNTVRILWEYKLNKKYRQLVIDLSLKIKKLEGDKRLLKQILKKSNVIVFDRHGYKKKSLNSNIEK